MHIGRNIEKLRTIKGIKQSELARILKMKQQEISRLEQKEHIPDDLLSKVAEGIGFDIEVIKNFKEEPLINSINQQGGSVITNNFNPLEKIIELYEKRIEDKDKMIALLEKQLSNQKAK